MTGAQNAGLQGTQNYANAAQPGIQAAEYGTALGMGAANPTALDGAAIGQYMSPYQQSVVDATGKQLQQQYGQAQSGALGAAVQSGAFGGDRAGIAAANLQNQQSLAYGQTMSGLYNQNYSQALQTAQQQQGVDLAAQQANLQRLQTGAGQIGQLAQAGQTAGLAGAQAEMGAGQVQQQTQQAGDTALYNQFLQQQSYPFQTTQFLANIAEGTGALSGQSTGTTQTAPFFSDRRLKENVKEIGKAKNGLKIYTFNYKGDPDKLTRMGFMADDVEKTHPDAVGLAGGYKTVDYDRAARAEGGGLLAPEHFDFGGFADRSGYDPTWSAQMRASEGMYGPQGGGLYGASGPVSGVPRGGNSYVPQSQVPQHRMLQPAQAPKPPDSGLHQVAGLAKDAVGDIDTAKKLYGAAGDGAKALGLSGGERPVDLHPAAAPAPAAAPPAAAPPAAAPAPADHAGLAGDAAPAPDGNGGLGDFISGLFKAHGGFIDDREHFDAGGDAYAGGPEGLYANKNGLDIPNETATARLPSAQQPPNNSGSGGGGILKDLGSIASLAALFADGGAVKPKRKKRARQ